MIDFTPDFNNGVFVLDLINRHSLADDTTVIPIRKRYTLKIDGNYEYKILGVEFLNAVTIRNMNSDKLLSLNNCELTLETISSNKDLHQNWWLVEVPNKTSVYTVRNTYDSTYGLCVNSDGRLLIKKFTNQSNYDEESLAFQFEFDKNSDGKLCIKSLGATEEQYLCETYGTPAIGVCGNMNWEININD